MSEAGAVTGAGSPTGERGLGVANDARLRFALLAVAEPPGVITESRFGGPLAFPLGVLAGDLTGDRTARGIFVGDLGTTGTP